MDCADCEDAKNPNEGGDDDEDSGDGGEQDDGDSNGDGDDGGDSETDAEPGGFDNEEESDDEKEQTEQEDQTAAGEQGEIKSEGEQEAEGAEHETEAFATGQTPGWLAPSGGDDHHTDATNQQPPAAADSADGGAQSAATTASVVAAPTQGGVLDSISSALGSVFGGLGDALGSAVGGLNDALSGPVSEGNLSLFNAMNSSFGQFQARSTAFGASTSYFGGIAAIAGQPQNDFQGGAFSDPSFSASLGADASGEGWGTGMGGPVGGTVQAATQPDVQFKNATPGMDLLSVDPISSTDADAEQSAMDATQQGSAPQIFAGDVQTAQSDIASQAAQLLSTYSNDPAGLDDALRTLWLQNVANLQDLNVLPEGGDEIDSNSPAANAFVTRMMAITGASPPTYGAVVNDTGDAGGSAGPANELLPIQATLPYDSSPSNIALATQVTAVLGDVGSVNGSDSDGDAADEFATPDPTPFLGSGYGGYKVLVGPDLAPVAGGNLLKYVDPTTGEYNIVDVGNFEYVETSPDDATWTQNPLAPAPPAWSFLAKDAQQRADPNDPYADAPPAFDPDTDPLFKTYDPDAAQRAQQSLDEEEVYGDTPAPPTQQSDKSSQSKGEGDADTQSTGPDDGQPSGGDADSPGGTGPLGGQPGPPDLPPGGAGEPDGRDEDSVDRVLKGIGEGLWGLGTGLARTALYGTPGIGQYFLYKDWSDLAQQEGGDPAAYFLAANQIGNPLLGAAVAGKDLVQAVGDDDERSVARNATILIGMAAIHKAAKGLGGEASGGGGGTVLGGEAPGVPSEATTWREAAGAVRAPGRYNVVVSSLEDARNMIGQAMPDAVELPEAQEGIDYPKPGGAKKWFQIQPAEPWAGNDLPHIKYADWTQGKKGSGGSWGHIFFVDPEGAK